MTRCIAVVSIGRSGSSALAGALHQAGISFGNERELMGPSPDFNPKGHFEIVKWWKHGCNVARAVQGGLPPAQSDIRALADLVAVRNAEQPAIWGVKTTTLAYSLPYLLPWLPNDVRLVVLHRRFDGIVASYMRHQENGSGTDREWATWKVTRNLARFHGALSTTLAHLPQYHVQFEDLTAQPLAELDGVLRFCLDDVTPYLVNMAAAWIDPGLRHW